MTKSKQIEGIDVSHWQGKIDFNKVKKAGKEFVILKAGGQRQNQRDADDTNGACEGGKNRASLLGKQIFKAQ